jgi:NAD(P)-dependent dehydrogenase (short-subunit alcohol dehydrogenase family)
MDYQKYRYVNYLWDDTVASTLDPVGRLVYRSNILGSDQRITNTGGGNTSAKILEEDPLTGEKVEVLWVKGSGGDLRTSKRENFSSLYQSRLIELQRLYAQEPEKGPKTPAEDKMVGMYAHATFNLNPRPPSIDTPLHAFIPFRHVDHMHPNAAISVAAAKHSEKLTKEIYGQEVIWTPWLRPGFELGLALQRLVEEHPQAKGVILGQHGLINWANDDKECYNLTLSLIERAADYEYIALPQQEAFDIEYWLLEEAKLRRMPAEKELARQVVVVIGAGSGIGKEVVHRIVKDGAHAVCVDLNQAAAEATAKEITDQYGVGIGVAGTGISNCGLAVGLSGNITDRASVRAILNNAVLAYGGFDSIAVTAGIFVAPDTAGHIPDEKWALTFAINVTGSYIVADEAAKTWKEQGLRGNLVLTTSANAVVAKKGSLAYDTSKAAANHLTRELAIELAPLVRVNAVAPATVVQGSAMFPRERVIASLAKYKIAYSEDEATESLTQKLAQFYADRTLTQSPITPADQAEAFYLLLTNRLSKTTGQVITVDGGLIEAFLR